MRISLNWLRELVDITLSPQELADLLTMAGFEVEDIEDRNTWAQGVVVGKILQATRHPNADKLQVCEVDIGASEPLSIVCGAANARSEIQVAVAPVGTFLPAVDLKIKKAKLRGVPSAGMICSLAELGLTKESEGIHIFTEEGLALGSDVRPLLGLDDVILDVTATANRGDALSLVGIAREIAALTGAPFRLPEAAGVLLQSSASPTPRLAVEITESSACPVYIGTVITGVKIGPSPQWLQQRLQASGIRPINNVVDVTNYILLEWGQPLHAFDQERLQGIANSPDLKLGVRFAQGGETLKTLDGQERTLTSQNLLITVQDHPIALAGVMGGEDSEVYEGTQNLVLEAAIFTPPVVRRSARAQGLRTEASIRYERGINQAELALACRRAIRLISELSGGVPVVQETASSVGEPLTRTVELRLERIHQILGQLKRGINTEYAPYLEPEEVEGILQALGCGLVRSVLDEAVVWTVTVPPYRYRDLEREIDLIEEVARLYGYDNFCDTLPHQGAVGYLPAELVGMRQVRAAFRAEGLTELMHYSLVKQTGGEQIALANPLFVEYSALRTELLSGLIDAFQYNLEQGNGALNGFEIGRIFAQQGDILWEGDAIGGIISHSPASWCRGGREQPLSWFEAKGILESVFRQLNLSVDYQPDGSLSSLHPGRTASLWLNGQQLGVFGQLHPQLSQQRELPDQVYAFQFDLGVLLAGVSQTQARQFHRYSTFPAADRDLAFFVVDTVSVQELEKVIRKAGGELLESVELFDEYRGEHVPTGERSLAFRLIYRVPDRTLTDADIEPVQQKVREVLVKEFNVSLRS